MHRPPVRTILLPLAAGLLLAGCLARAAVDVATAPVKAAAKVGEIVYDSATESQEEADLKRGREMREAEERAERERRKAERERRRAAEQAAREQADAPVPD